MTAVSGANKPSPIASKPLPKAPAQKKPTPKPVNDSFGKKRLSLADSVSSKNQAAQNKNSAAKKPSLLSRIKSAVTPKSTKTVKDKTTNETAAKSTNQKAASLKTNKEKTLTPAELKVQNEQKHKNYTNKLETTIKNLSSADQIEKTALYADLKKYVVSDTFKERYPTGKSKNETLNELTNAVKTEGNDSGKFYAVEDYINNIAETRETVETKNTKLDPNIENIFHKWNTKVKKNNIYESKLSGISNDLQDLKINEKNQLVTQLKDYMNSTDYKKKSKETVIPNDWALKKLDQALQETDHTFTDKIGDALSSLTLFSNATDKRLESGVEKILFNWKDDKTTKQVMTHLQNPKIIKQDLYKDINKRLQSESYQNKYKDSQNIDPKRIALEEAFASTNDHKTKNEGIEKALAAYRNHKAEDGISIDSGINQILSDWSAKESKIDTLLITSKEIVNRLKSTTNEQQQGLFKAMNYYRNTLDYKIHHENSEKSPSIKAFEQALDAKNSNSNGLLNYLSNSIKQRQPISYDEAMIISEWQQAIGEEGIEYERLDDWKELTGTANQSEGRGFFMGYFTRANSSSSSRQGTGRGGVTSSRMPTGGGKGRRA